MQIFSLKSVKSRLNFGKIWGFETGLVPLQMKIYKDNRLNYNCLGKVLYFV